MKWAGAPALRCIFYRDRKCADSKSAACKEADFPVHWLTNSSLDERLPKSNPRYFGPALLDKPRLLDKPQKRISRKGRAIGVVQNLYSRELSHIRRLPAQNATAEFQLRNRPPDTRIASDQKNRNAAVGLEQCPHGGPSALVLMETVLRCGRTQRYRGSPPVRGLLFPVGVSAPTEGGG